MAYLIIILIAIGLIAYFLISRKSNTISEGSAKPKHNPFNELRKQALHITKEQLQLTDDSELYGLIMDWDLGNGIMTLTTFRTGDASMYLSSGGGVIGGGQHQKVRTAVASYLNTAERFLKDAKAVEHMDLPPSNSINFYFLTTNGRFLVTERIDHLENESSSIGDLFNGANQVITELRQIAE